MELIDDGDGIARDDDLSRKISALIGDYKPFVLVWDASGLDPASGTIGISTFGYQRPYQTIGLLQAALDHERGVTGRP